MDVITANIQPRSRDSAKSKLKSFEPLVTIEEASAFLGIKVQTIRVWCLQRRIPFRKAGSRLRFLISELDEWTKILANRKP